MKDYFATAANWLMPFILIGFSAVATAAESSDLRLMMVEQPGCIWCARWHDEVGPVYPKTPEATVAPIEFQQLVDDLPAGVSFTRPARLTPTFVLLEHGAEVGRIEGYPGEDFFWSMLSELIASASATPAD